MHENRESVVLVGSWQNSRRLIEADGKVALEIALSHDHCPTCASRMRFVIQRLGQRNVQYSWTYPNGRSFVQLDHPGAGLPVRQFLTDLLGVSVR